MKTEKIILLAVPLLIAFGVLLRLYWQLFETMVAAGQATWTELGLAMSVGGSVALAFIVLTLRQMKKEG